MYDTSLVTGRQTQITVATEGSERTAALYSREGLEIVAALWLKLSAEYRLMYEPAWLGVPIIQLPSDIVAMQELIWKLRPELIIECGVAHGGSAILYASLLELIGHGEVIAVDCEIRQYNRVALMSHPLSRRIRLVEASSIAPETAARLRMMAAGREPVLVVLDSNHSAGHVQRELDLYHDLVTAGSYIVVMDGAQAHVWDTPGGKPEWRTSHPLAAIEEFLAAHQEFEEDPHYGRFEVTSSPRGFLRRKQESL
jgi:cephalosporin hydroxylase